MADDTGRDHSEKPRAELERPVDPNNAGATPYPDQDPDDPDTPTEPYPMCGPAGTRFDHD